MPRVEIQKVPESSDRSLPIFAEFDKIADQIRTQAYNLFAHRGAQDGRALDDWLMAERELCWPTAELAEKGKQFSLRIALAGFEPTEITVTATPREIIVKAAHEHEESGGNGEAKLRWSEFMSKNVFRRIELPAPVDVDKVSASLSNGMLEITARKARAEAETAKKIEVSTPS
jgi:HSP20 family molecular chaperone IbpA